MPNRGTGVYLHPSTRLFNSAPSGSGTPGGPRSASGRPFMAGRERRQFQGEWPLHYGRAIEKNPGNLAPIVSSYSCVHFLGACSRSVFCHVKMFGCQDFRKSGCLESWMDSWWEDTRPVFRVCRMPLMLTPSLVWGHQSVPVSGGITYISGCLVSGTYTQANSTNLTGDARDTSQNDSGIISTIWHNQTRSLFPVHPDITKLFPDTYVRPWQLVVQRC